MGPVTPSRSGPPWSVRVIIRMCNWVGIRGCAVPDASVGPPWPHCIKTASEAGLEAWVGRRDIICDAGVTPDMDAAARDTH